MILLSKDILLFIEHGLLQSKLNSSPAPQKHALLSKAETHDGWPTLFEDKAVYKYLSLRQRFRSYLYQF